MTDHEAEIARLTAALAQSRAEAQAALAGCVAQCCMCGKNGLSTVEDGGPECELSDGRWVCSSGCYERAIQPDTSKLALALVRAALQSGVDLICGQAVGTDWKRGCNEFVKQARIAIAEIDAQETPIMAGDKS